MINKKIVIGIASGIALTALISGLVFFIEEEAPKISEHEHQKTVKKTVKPAVVKPIEIKTHNLYTNTPYNIPLSAIVEITKASEKAQKTTEGLLENAQGFYFVKFNENNKTLEILLENPVTTSETYPRHNIELAYIDNDGNIKYTAKGYNGENGEVSNAVEAENDIWEFDKSVEPNRPVKHVAYDEHDNVKFTEVWNYDENEPVKYEMKDGNDKIVSILKETVDHSSNYRKEHVFYNKDGKTELSLSVNYDGANLSRLTYYDAKNHEGISIISEFTDGNKTKEVVYNQEYELQNTLKSDYENGIRKNITVLDADSKEIETLSN